MAQPLAVTPSTATTGVAGGRIDVTADGNGNGSATSVPSVNSVNTTDGARSEAEGPAKITDSEMSGPLSSSGQSPPASDPATGVPAPPSPPDAEAPPIPGPTAGASSDGPWNRSNTLCCALDPYWIRFGAAHVQLWLCISTAV